jgi:hypothetical protein
MSLSVVILILVLIICMFVWIIIMAGYVFIGNGFQSGYGVANLPRDNVYPICLLLEPSDIVCFNLYVATN